MNSTLAILCITRAEDSILPLLDELQGIADGIGARLVLVADGREAAKRLRIEPVAVVNGRGFIESVLDEALGHVRSDWVLRIDDDELPSPAMIRWLDDGAFKRADVWSFPRVHLWEDRHTAIVTPALYPDHQTRLAVRAKAGGRKSIHCPSPYGLGEIAEVAIEHHKFLVKSAAERREIVTRYDRIEEGAGSRFRAYSVPEDFYPAGEFGLREWDGERLA